MDVLAWLGEVLIEWGSLMALATAWLVLILARRKRPLQRAAFDCWSPGGSGFRELTFAVAALAGLGLFAKIAGDMAQGRLEQFDLHVLQTTRSLTPPGSAPLLDVVTFLGSTPLLGALIVTILLFLLWRKQWKDARLLLAAGALALGLSEGLKRTFQRARPELIMYHDDSYSFPSGHALGSLVIYGVLVYLAGQAYPRWRFVLWSSYLALLLAIGFSRVYLGVHWPTDVVAGWAAGSLLLFAMIYWHEGRYHLPAMLWDRLRKLIRSKP